MRARQKENSVLVSSEAGFARFWAFPGFTDPRGTLASSIKLSLAKNYVNESFNIIIISSIMQYQWIFNESMNI